MFGDSEARSRSGVQEGALSHRSWFAAVASHTCWGEGGRSPSQLGACCCNASGPVDVGEVYQASVVMYSVYNDGAQLEVDQPAYRHSATSADPLGWRNVFASIS